MDRRLFSRQNWWRDGLLVLGWLFVMGVGVGLVWYSFSNNGAAKPSQPTAESDAVLTLMPQATVSPTLVAPVFPTATSTPPPTPLPLPSPTPEPTAVPPTPTPTPYIVAGEDGVNVRTGPDVSNEQIGYIDPGGQAEYLGTEGNWVQIKYEGEVAWVYAPLVTVYETGGTEEPAVETPAVETPTVETPAASPAPTGEIVAWSEEIAQLINQKRAEQGLAAYTASEALKQAALLHAVDSAEVGELTHTGSDGSTLSVRVERAGYSSTNVSEITVTGPSPQFAIDWWMNETPPNDPHRREVLNDTKTEMGAAVVAAGDTYYFVVVFGQP